LGFGQEMFPEKARNDDFGQKVKHGKYPYLVKTQKLWEISMGL
jgi:hypothetical protein